MLWNALLLQPLLSYDNGALTQYLDAYVVQDKIVFARHTIGKRLDLVGLPSLPKYLLLSEFCTWHNAKALEFRYSGHEIAFSSFDGMVTGKLNEDSKVLNLKIAQGAVKQCLVKPLQPTRKSDFAFRKNLDYLIPLDVALWMGRGDMNLVRNRLEMDTIKQYECDKLLRDKQARRFEPLEPGAPVVSPPEPFWGFCRSNSSKASDGRLELRVIRMSVGSKDNLTNLPPLKSPLGYHPREILKYMYALELVVKNRSRNTVTFYPALVTLIVDGTPLFSMPVSPWEFSTWYGKTDRPMSEREFPRVVTLEPGQQGRIVRGWWLNPTDKAEFYYNDGVSKFRIPLKRIGFK